MVGKSVYAFYGPRLEMSIPGNILGMTGASRIRILLAGNNPTTVDYARQDRAGFSFPADPVPIVIDGAFGDWRTVPTIGTDPSGDVPACPGSPRCTGGNVVDWTEFRASRANGTLYLYYNTVNWLDFGENFWRYGVLIDTDNNALTGYRGVNGTGGEYLIEGGTLYRYTGTGLNWSWSLVTPLSWGVFASRLELAVAEQYLALPSTSYTIRFRLVGNNPSTADLAPNAGAGYSFTAQ